MPHLTARVIDRRVVARDVLRIELEPTSGPFPVWTPGAHVDVVLANGEARQYSLTGAPEEGRWVIAVLVEAEGRGGSLWISEQAQVGALLTLSLPRNHFAYSSAGPAKKVFLAGGIGITPMIPMIAQAEADGLEWELHYVGRGTGHMAFLDELAEYGHRVQLYPRDTAPRPDLGRILSGRDAVDLYCCGPESLMEDAEALGPDRPGLEVHVERFVPRPIEGDRGFEEFDVVFDYSGVEAHVAAGQTILAAAEGVGIDVPTSCREGTCGTCETPILSGQVVHLDSVLSDAERKASTSMMICISRATCPRLVLDL